MQKQPVVDELIKLQSYIRRFCPELSNVKFSRTRYRNLTDEELDELIEKYVSNIISLATQDDRIN